jgi:Raf kinase inhibitor-like YbhB/YbcL family protein
VLEKTPAAVGHALESVRAGEDKTFWADPKMAAPESLEVTSASFADGAVIPKRFTEDGSRTSPALTWSGVPAAARSVVVVVEDADSPTPAPFVHLLARVDVDETSFVEGAFTTPIVADGLVLGHNTMRGLGWLPPDPPPGHGPHRYLFQVYALDHDPDLKSGAEKHDFERAVHGHVVARGKFVGIYQRPG